MPSFLSLLLPMPLAVAGVLASGPGRRLAWLGAIAFGLGTTSVRVALRLPLGGTPDPLWVGALPPMSLRVDAGLVLLGAVLALAAAIAAWRMRQGAAPKAAAVIAMACAAGMAFALVPLASAAGWGGTIAAMIAIGGAMAIAGALLLAAARAIGRHRTASAAPPITLRGPAFWRGLLAVGGALAVAAPHVFLSFGGAVLAAVAAHALSDRSGIRSIPVLPATAAAALGFAGYYLHVIAGPSSLAVTALPEAPLSTAAQAFLLPAVAIAAVAFIAPWPVHRIVPGPWLAPIGAALLVRIAAEAFPLGIEGWRTVAVPLGVLSAWGAVMARRADLLAAAVAWAAAFAPGSGGGAGAILLSVVPLLMGLTLGGNRAGATTIRAISCAAAASLGAVLAADGLFRAEVVYGTCITAALAFAVVYISPAHN